ncbi:MAG: type II and III secretion system protein [Acidobacteria bacterium]|nr:MAG: type II and III secretion system protein [Acidobacteriota bacterium]
MRRFVSLATIVFVVLAVTLPVAADSARTNYNKGMDAEKRQDYERAFEYYQEAYRQKPKDLRYRTAYEHTKFLAGAAHVHRGQLLRDGGKLDEALAEFQKASTIDPSSFIAQQELRRTQDMINKATNPPQSVAPMPDSLRKRLAEAQGPVELSAISNVPITLKLTEDTKVIYETVGKLAGINVLFDPDYTSRKIRIELNGVTLEEALGIIALESKTFWRPVTPNTVFVATDNPAKRKELDQSVIKTFYLSNLSQATELQDVVNAVRTLLEVQRIQQLQSQNAIIVRGTPDQIALAQKLVDDLDKAKSEVVIDVVVMQVSRDKSRTLGITPPTSTSISLNNNINTTPTTNPQTGVTTTPTTSGTSTASGGINLNRIGNLNATDFTITIPGITASAIIGDSNTKIIQNPQIRALDGQKATLKIGDRVPVATGSFQPGIGGVGINPLVNTQFQYLDVGVNIDITPRVHAGREVSLKVSLDISSVTGNSNIGGISQPIIGQRKIEHEIRLKEGEVNLLGGMIEEDQTQSLSGLPILAQIPFLKYFFGQDVRDHRENELVFALIPHIVRGPDVNDSNQRLIDVGTANALQLRHISKVETVPAGQAAALAGAPGQAPPAANPARPTPSVAPVTGASFLFDPGAITAAKAQTFTVNILISGAQNVYSVPLQLNYDPSKLQLMNVSNGGFLSQDGQTVALVHREDETTGTLQITATRPPNSGGVSGQGSVVTLTFMAKASGQSPLTITRGGARDPSMQAITVNGAQAVVTIQ